MLSGEHIGAMGMTEPAVGTDVLGMQTTARKVGDTYIINGRKTFITNGPEGHVFLVYAKLADRITSFVVERGFATNDVIRSASFLSRTRGPGAVRDERLAAVDDVGVARPCARVVCMPSRWVPTAGSVMPIAPMCSPLSTRGRGLSAPVRPRSRSC